MPEQQFKRNVAYKLRIGEVLIGKPVFDQERFSFVELGTKRIVRLNLVGNVIEKIENDGETKYLFFTIDDGSGQIQVRCFGEDFEKFKNIEQGETILVIGVLRYFNEKLYLSPEIIKDVDPKYLLLRKLEIEKEKDKNSEPLERNQIVAVKDKILGTIKNAEEVGGIEVDKIIMNLKDISPTIINQEIQKFLEEGLVFEPRPGKVRYLG